MKCALQDVNRVGRGCICAALLLACPAAAGAQTLSGYGVAGVAGFSAFFDSHAPMVFAGGGVEVVGGPGVGAGADLGVFADNTGAMLGVLSINGVAQFSRRGNRKIVPFLTAGYTLAYGPESSFTAWNIGGGVSWWREHTGLRVEFRDHIRPDFRGTSHYWTLRAGIAFR
jgi:hypothetical protein